MQTECPHCHTVFRINEADLHLADGQVRCGHCLAIFTADNPDNTITYEDTGVSAEDEKDQDDFQPVVADVIPLNYAQKAGKVNPDMVL